MYCMDISAQRMSQQHTLLLFCLLYLTNRSANSSSTMHIDKAGAVFWQSKQSGKQRLPSYLPHRHSLLHRPGQHSLLLPLPL